MPPRKERVVVVGASHNHERYSNQVVRLLVQCGHEVVPIHPAAASIEGFPVVCRLKDLNRIFPCKFYKLTLLPCGMH